MGARAPRTPWSRRHWGWKHMASAEHEPITSVRGRSRDKGANMKIFHPPKLKPFHLLDAQQKQQIRFILRIFQTGESCFNRDRPPYLLWPAQKHTVFESVARITSGKSGVDKACSPPHGDAPEARKYIGGPSSLYYLQLRVTSGHWNPITPALSPNRI